MTESYTLNVDQIYKKVERDLERIKSRKGQIGYKDSSDDDIIKQSVKSNVDEQLKEDLNMSRDKFNKTLKIFQEMRDKINNSENIRITSKNNYNDIDKLLKLILKQINFFKYFKIIKDNLPKEAPTYDFTLDNYISEILIELKENRKSKLDEIYDRINEITNEILNQLRGSERKFNEFINNITFSTGREYTDELIKENIIDSIKDFKKRYIKNETDIITESNIENQLRNFITLYNNSKLISQDLEKGADEVLGYRNFSLAQMYLAAIQNSGADQTIKDLAIHLSAVMGYMDNTEPTYESLKKILLEDKYDLKLIEDKDFIKPVATHKKETSATSVTTSVNTSEVNKGSRVGTDGSVGTDVSVSADAPYDRNDPRPVITNPGYESSEPSGDSASIYESEYSTSIRNIIETLNEEFDESNYNDEDEEKYIERKDYLLAQKIWETTLNNINTKLDETFKNDFNEIINDEQISTDESLNRSIRLILNKPNFDKDSKKALEKKHKEVKNTFDKENTKMYNENLTKIDTFIEEDLIKDINVIIRQNIEYILHKFELYRFLNKGITEGADGTDYS